LLNAKVYLDTESLFAWIIAIVALSMAFEKIVNWILHIGKKGRYDDRS
jgi:ABC-type nitrate/sulfonate/bicarbonate transport system permease component